MNQTARNAAQTQLKLKAIVVIPTYHEPGNIADVLAAVLVNGPQCHALVVDDNSPRRQHRQLGTSPAHEQSHGQLPHPPLSPLAPARLHLAFPLLPPRHHPRTLQPHTLTATSYAVLEEILYRCKRLGITPAEHPSTFADRRLGTCKVSFAESLKVFAFLIKLACSGWRPES